MHARVRYGLRRDVLALRGEGVRPSVSVTFLSLANLSGGVVGAVYENENDDSWSFFLERRFGLGKELNRRSLAAAEGFSRRTYSLRYVSADRLVMSWFVWYCLGFRPLQSRTFGSAPARGHSVVPAAASHATWARRRKTKPNEYIENNAVTSDE